MSWTTLAIKLIAALGVATAAGCTVADRRATEREARFEAAAPPIGNILTLEDGRKVHAYVEGTGPDLVLIHGASGNLRDFTFDLVGRLSDRYRVIAFDRPGMGYTDRADSAYNTARNFGAESLAEQITMLQAAADQLQITDPVVLGHSYGGAVALAWALERPAQTKALVIVSGASNPWPGGLGASYTIASSSLGGQGLVPFVTAYMPREKIEEIVDGVFDPQAAPDGYADYLGAGLALRRHSLRANARQVTSLKPQLKKMVPAYSTLHMPAEIVHGTADTTVPPQIHAEPLSQQLPNAELTLLEGIGHMPHHVAPQAIVDAIDRAARRAGLRTGQ